MSMLLHLLYSDCYSVCRVITFAFAHADAPVHITCEIVREGNGRFLRPVHTVFLPRGVFMLRSVMDPQLETVLLAFRRSYSARHFITAIQLGVQILVFEDVSSDRSC